MPYLADAFRGLDDALRGVTAMESAPDSPERFYYWDGERPRRPDIRVLRRQERDSLKELLTQNQKSDLRMQADTRGRLAVFGKTIRESQLMFVLNARSISISAVRNPLLHRVLKQYAEEQGIQYRELQGNPAFTGRVPIIYWPFSNEREDHSVLVQQSRLVERPLESPEADMLQRLIDNQQAMMDNMTINTYEAALTVDNFPF